MIAYTNYRTDPRVIREAEAAASAGFDVDFLALRRADEPSEERIGGVRVIHLDQVRYRGRGVFRYMLSYLEFFLRCALKTTWLHLRRRYSAVHVNNMPDFFVFCALFPKLTGARVMLDIHDPMPNTFASKFKSGENGFFFKLLLWQERICAAFADQVLTVHEPLKEHVLVRQHGLAASSIAVIANFPDDRLFSPREPATGRPQLRLAFHGTILERYGLGDAMRALAGMRHKDRVAVKLIGEGDFSEQLKDLIRTLDLSRIVEFDNRMYPIEEIPRRIAGCNVGLVPLEISSVTNYALPLKLLEYLCLGMPSVTVRNAAIAYYFCEGDCLFYEPSDPDSLRIILDRLAADSSLLSTYQQRALELRRRFLWSNEKHKYINLLRALTEQSSHTTSGNSHGVH